MSSHIGPYTLVVLAVLVFCVSNGRPITDSDDALRTATVYYHEPIGYDIKYGVLDKENGVAYATYNRTQNETGWGVLNIGAGYSTKRNYSDQVIMKAAGMLEGALTQPELYDTYRSQMEFWFHDAIPDAPVDKIKSFYADQRVWMEKMIGNNPSDRTWQYVGLIYQQFKGLMEGYASAASKNQSIDTFGFDLLCGNGDFLDIHNFINYSSVYNERMKEAGLRGHCSVLFKVLPGYENIFASHSSWYIYSSMLRIYKHYSFKLNDREDNPACVTMSFSSYPGFLSSLDDFYIMDSQLLMLQTTNPIDDPKAYSKATPNALLAWHRVRLANWLAVNGREWAEYIREYNSGTYNNQYMVLDLKKVELKKEIQDDAFWVVEQIPGLVEASDETAILREGYWASYNVPFFTNISVLSGIPESVNKYGPQRSHDLAPRAKIFRRDQGTVHDLSTMQAIMRYNGFKMDDPYAEGSPVNAICSRGDLILDHPTAGGCTDTKITDYNLAKAMTAVIMNGPTHTNGLPVFKWSNASADAPHYGQPNEFDFDWNVQTPQL